MPDDEFVKVGSTAYSEQVQRADRVVGEYQDRQKICSTLSARDVGRVIDTGTSVSIDGSQFTVGELMHILTSSYGRGFLIIRNLGGLPVEDILRLADAGSANVTLEI